MRTELVSGWTSQKLLTRFDHKIKKGKLVYKNFLPNDALVLSFDSTVEILQCNADALGFPSATVQHYFHYFPSQMFEALPA